MKIIEDLKGLANSFRTFEPETKQSPGVHPNARLLFTQSYDGEKDPGAIGPIETYAIDHYGLSARSWQAYLESDAVQDVIKKYVKWVVGTGLDLNANPNELVLKSEGINVNEDLFSKLTENRFKIYSNSKESVYSGEMSLQALANDAYKAAILSGDVLVIHRVKDGLLTSQILDGRFIMDPSPAQVAEARSRGNIISDGVEINKRGAHVAYFVELDTLQYKRVLANTKPGRTAYMVYGSKYRPGDVRGIPLTSAILETVAKLDRYKEATIGSAEERQKIAYAIEHDAEGTGQNPLLSKLRKETEVIDGTPYDTARNLVAETTQKAVFNLPQGAKMTLLESRNELYFTEFFTTNMRMICATIGIPMEVALSWYDSNYSASRAALKDWEHTLIVERKFFSDQFYRRVYSLWLDIEILTGKIDASGYINARNSKNFMVLEAYRNAVFFGANIPHIDPLKEVQAERLKLGAQGANIPLTTAEDATKVLSGDGEYTANVNQFKREVKELGELNVIPEAPGEKTEKKEDKDEDE